jgi:hypothetical protein
MQVLDGLDEMRLAEDKIHVGRLFDFDGFKFHVWLHPQITQIALIVTRRNSPR